MNPNEIKKALPKILYAGHGCSKCKYANVGGDERCGLKGCYISRQTLAYINQLEDEIDRLLNTRITKHSVENQIKTAKSDAIKEFARLLKAEAMAKCDWDNCVDVDDIDDLVKEMVGDT